MHFREGREVDVLEVGFRRKKTGSTPWLVGSPSGIVSEGRGFLFLFLLLLAVLGDDLLLDVRGHRLVVAQGHGVAAPAAGDAL